MAHSALRLVEMLRVLPSYPRSMSVSSLLAHLRANGYEIERRSVERDLKTLSRKFPITHDDAKPMGWQWAKGEGFSAPGLTPADALGYEMLVRYLEPLLPAAFRRLLEPRLREARATLSMMRSSPMGQWQTRVAFLDDGAPLLPPTTDADVVAVVHDCLLRGVRFEVDYLAANAAAPTRYPVNPVALIQHGRVGYLVATMFDYEDLRHLALHRMSNPVSLDQPAKLPEGFDLNAYLRRQSAFDIPSGRTIRLELIVDDWLCRHLTERPLSDDQTIVATTDEGRSRVIARVVESERLFWWLRSHGSSVDVRRPAALRRRMASDAKALVAHYVDDDHADT